MNLTLETATFSDNTYSWVISLPHYKIKSITVLSLTRSFKAGYNHGVIQYLESGRTDECPAIFSGDFSVQFFNRPPFTIVEVQDIQIELVEYESPPPPPVPVLP